MNSEYILKIYDFFENYNYYFFILEYCSDGTLLDYVNLKKPS
jgi:serine/threonine protein kinase